MKKFLIGLLTLALILTAAGCGVKEKLGKMAGEALVENVLKGAGIDVDIGDDKLVIKGDDGEELKIGGSEWPTSALAKNLPEFKSGRIATVMETDDTLYVVIEDVSEKDFKNYLEKIKETFDVDKYEATSDTGIAYSAKNKKDLAIMITLNKNSEVTIALAREDQ